MELIELFEKNEEGLWIPKYRIGEIVETIIPHLRGMDSRERKISYYGGLRFSQYLPESKKNISHLFYRPPIERERILERSGMEVEIHTTLSKKELKDFSREEYLQILLPSYYDENPRAGRVALGGDRAIDEVGRLYRDSCLEMDVKRIIEIKPIAVTSSITKRYKLKRLMDIIRE